MGKTFAKPLEILSGIVYNEANNKEEKAARERQLRKKEVSPMNNEELFEQDGLEEGIMDEAKLDEVLDPYHLTVPGAGLR